MNCNTLYLPHDKFHSCNHLKTYFFQKKRWGFIQEPTHMSSHFLLVNQGTSPPSRLGILQHQVYRAGYQLIDIPGAGKSELIVLYAFKMIVHRTCLSFCLYFTDTNKCCGKWVKTTIDILYHICPLQFVRNTLFPAKECACKDGKLRASFWNFLFMKKNINQK